MADAKKLSETMRIDLIPEHPRPAPGATPLRAPEETALRAPISPFTRMNWDHKPQRKKTEVSAPSHYQELLQSMYDGTVITSLDGQIVDFNDRALDFFKYDRGQLFAMQVNDLIAGADETLLDTLRENLKTERFTFIQAYCLCKGGQTFPAEIAVNRLLLNELRLCFFFRDITLRRQAEELLRAEHTAIQNAANGIVMADLDGRLNYVNPAFAAMLDREVEALMGRNLRELVEPASEAENLIETAMGEHRTQARELHMRKRSGNSLSVQAVATRHENTDGETIGLVFSFADCTVLRQVTAELTRLRVQQDHVVAERTRELMEKNGRLLDELAELRRLASAAPYK